jgi:hypothetical protein
MIQLANDPHASRSFSRAAANDAGKESGEARQARGHAWPFLSRMDARPTREENSPKPAAKDSGS